MGVLQTGITMRTTPNGVSQLYPNIVHYKAISEEDLVKFMVETAGVSRNTAYAAIAGLQNMVKNHLCNGHSLKIPELGTLRPTLKAKGVDKPEDCTFSTIEKVKIAFTPMKAVKNACKSVSFKGVIGDELEIYTTPKTASEGA